MTSDGSLSPLHDEAPPPNIVHAALQFLRILRRRKLCVVLSLMVAVLAGGAYFSVAPRRYEARASVLVLQTGRDVWSPTLSDDGPRTSLIPTFEKLFSSEVVLEGALQQLSDMPAGTRIDLEGVPREQHLEVLARNLRAAGTRNTNVIDVSYRSRSPQAAAAIVDAVVQSYLTYMAQNHKNVSVELVATLDQERLQIQEQFRRKERELAEARSRAGDLGLKQADGQLHPAVERAVSVNQKLVAVQAERLQLQASLNAIQQAAAAGGDLQQHLAAVEPLVGSDLLRSGLGLSEFDQRIVPELEARLLNDQARLRSVSEHYGPNHPQVVQLRESIENTRRYLAEFQDRLGQRYSQVNQTRLGETLVSIVSERLSSIRAYEAELIRHYRQAEAEAIRHNDRFMEVTLLEHDLERLRELHDTLLNRITNLDIQQNQADVRVAIVNEPRVDPRPVSPRLRMVALMCLLVGCGIGALLAYVLDLLDDRFRSPEQLRHELGAQVLAVIPQIAAGAGAGEPVARTNDPATTEAFRTLRTTLAFSGEERSRLVVTSAEPGDGKTTVISQLAAAFGVAGKRTLLIDADMRKPGLSRLFRMRGQPGLSDILRSDAELEPLCTARIRPSGLPGVDVLPCGPKPSDPLELLGRARFEDLLGWAETRYDQVLVDTPPVLAASDSAVAGRLTDGVLLVVQPQKNHRRLVLRAVDELNALRVRLVGIVANRIDPDAADGYYGYGYGYGYGEDEEDEPQDLGIEHRAAA